MCPDLPRRGNPVCLPGHADIHEDKIGYISFASFTASLPDSAMVHRVYPRRRSCTCTRLRMISSSSTIQVLRAGNPIGDRGIQGGIVLQQRDTSMPARNSTFFAAHSITCRAATASRTDAGMARGPGVSCARTGRYRPGARAAGPSGGALASSGRRGTYCYRRAHFRRTALLHLCRPAAGSGRYRLQPRGTGVTSSLRGFTCAMGRARLSGPGAYSLPAP